MPAARRPPQLAADRHEIARTVPAAKKPAGKPAAPPPPKPKPAPAPAPARPASKPASAPKPAAKPSPKPAAKAAQTPAPHATAGKSGRPASKPASKPKPAAKPPAKPPAKPAGKPAGTTKAAGHATGKPSQPAKKPAKGTPAAKAGAGKNAPKPKVKVKAHPASKPAGGGGGSSVSLGRFESTAYGPPWDHENGTGITATGVDLRPAKHAYIIAVDPSVIRLHTKVHVVPNPFGDNAIVFAAEDVGGGIKSRHVDIYDWRGRSHQLGWGVRTVELTTASGAAGEPAPGGSGGSTSGAHATNVYHNPLANARVRAERIDQGVDYAGTGWLAAIADGIVTESAPGGWGKFGNYVEYKITQPGQLDGAYVYYAEGVESNVHKGQQLSGGDKVATLIPGWSYGIEVGFAAGDGGYHTYYHYHDGPYNERGSTLPGVAFSNLIELLKGPPGVDNGAHMGKWPEYAPNGRFDGITDSGVIPASGGGIDFTPGDAQTEANTVDWGASVKRKWHNMQTGGYNGAHHSGSARAFALGKDHVTI